jgi:hypothetical protein
VGKSEALSTDTAVKLAPSGSSSLRIGSELLRALRSTFTPPLFLRKKERSLPYHLLILGSKLFIPRTDENMASWIGNLILKGFGF